MTNTHAATLLFALSGVATLSGFAVPAHATEPAPVLYRTFDPASGGGAESITFDDAGNMYMSIGATVQRLTPSGTLEVFGTLPIAAFALGVKVGPDGCVYNASTSLDPAVVGAFVWRTCTQGDTEQFAALDPVGGPNDLAFDRYGNLFVTDPIAGKIWKVDPAGNAGVWLDHTLLKGNPSDPALFFSQQGVNGIAFDRHGDLFVGNLDYGRILKIEVEAGAQPGSIHVFADSPELRGADGIAFDQHQRLYVAVGAQDQLVSVNRLGQVEVESQSSLLHGPSSVVFGTRSCDRQTLYISDLDFLRAFGFIDETPQPNLLKLQTNTQGLPLLP